MIIRLFGMFHIPSASARLQKKRLHMQSKILIIEELCEDD